jgi:hypothetical protein
MFRCTKGTKSWHIRRAVKPGTRTRMLLHIAEAHKTQLGRQMTDAHKYVLNTCCSPIWPHTAPSSARARNKLLRTRWPAHSGYGRSYTYAPHPPRVLGTSIWQRREHFGFYAFSYWLAVLICFRMSNRPKKFKQKMQYHYGLTRGTIMFVHFWEDSNYENKHLEKVLWEMRARIVAVRTNTLLTACLFSRRRRQFGASNSFTCSGDTRSIYSRPYTDYYPPTRCVSVHCVIKSK